jgi:hypothetical protein
MECPAYQAIRADFQELYDDCRGDMRKLMCHPMQHIILAKLVHKMRVFRDEDGEYLFDTQLDLFNSDELPITNYQLPNGLINSDEDVGGDIFEDGDDDGNELVEIDVELRQLGFVGWPVL